MPPGQRRVTVSASLVNGTARLDIADSGAGVSGAIRDRLFEPFTTDKPDGVGLGLTTARDLVRAVGGDITLSDDRGSTHFRIELPSQTIPPS
jgi:signal transduction histidine kinase